ILSVSIKPSNGTGSFATARYATQRLPPQLASSVQGCEVSWQTPAPKRGTTTGPTPDAKRVLKSNSGSQVLPGQSAAPVHGIPAFVPAGHIRLAMRSTVSGASADPNSVTSLVTVGSTRGSKTGASLPPSREKEATNWLLGM